VRGLLAVSIRTQLAVLTTLLALPATGVVIYSGLRARQEAILSAQLESQQLAASIVAAHETHLTAAQQIAAVLAQLPAVRNNEPGVSATLTEVVKLDPAFLNILIAGPDGAVRASGIPHPTFNVGDRRYFRAALTTGRFSSGEYSLSRATGRPVLNLGYPFRGPDGKIAGVIAVAFDLRVYERLLSTASLPPEANFLLADHRGVIMTRTLDGWQGKRLRDDMLRTMEAGPDAGTYVVQGLVGEQRIVSWRKLRLPGEDTPYLYVRAGIPLAVAISGANAALAHNVALLLSFVLLGVMLAALAGKALVTDRIALLESASRRLADGDREVRVGELVHGGELGLLARTFDRMAEKIALREKALQETERSLLHAQKMETVGRLAGGVAHDFNNMLAVILGEVTLAREDLPAGHPVHASIDEIEKAAIRSRDVTRQLLGFSRKQVISPRPLDLNAAITSTRPALARLIGEDVVLRLVLEPDLWDVRLDPGQLDQILVNLAVNARDAMPDGGCLVVETRNVVLDEAAAADHPDARAGPFVRLAVEDGGAGMGADVLAHLFEPFFTTKETGKGTGLGLATVYGIVSQNGGFIRVRSAPGRGTRFEIFVPRLEEKGAPAAAPPEPTPPPARGTVLLVEDDDMVRGVAHRMLEKLGYDVVMARTPDEALAAAASGTPIDLLLTDVIMPGMKGPELRDRLAALRPGLRTLFMSGYGTDVVGQRGVLREDDHFLHKPFDLDELARQVRRAIG